MKLPSVTQIVLAARATMARFPLVILTAFAGTVAILILIDYEGPPGPTFLVQVLFAAVLGIPLLTGLVLLAEKMKWSGAVALGAQIVGLILLAAYATTVPQVLTDIPAIHVIRLLILSVALHLFVAVAPYVGPGEIEEFWSYNKTLFSRVLTGALYTGVLWIGLAVALAALDNLFGVNIPGKRYGELWMILVGLFNTWFVLAGVPEDGPNREGLAEYPKGLKIFTQYILFPLVFVYLVILYAYTAKILISWDWPQGWVSKLILGFAGTGIFSLLMVHPISGRSENIWIRNASRWFYLALIPLVIMLFFAVWRRVSEYGFTEGRYLAIALGIWLCVLVVYSLLSKKGSIKFIPGSLCVAAFAVSVGPWGVSAVSEQSQVARLQELLKENKILVDGRVHSAGGAIPFDDRKQISSIVAYLQMFHGLGSIQPWFSEDLLADSTVSAWTYKDPAAVTKLMGIEYTRAWQFGRSGVMFFTPDSKRAVGIGGYDHLVRIRAISPDALVKEMMGDDYGYRVNKDLGGLLFWTVRNGAPADSVQVEFGPMLAGLLEESVGGSVDNIPPERMTLAHEGKALRVKMFFVQLEVERAGDGAKVLSFNANLFYAFNPRN